LRDITKYDKIEPKGVILQRKSTKKGAYPDPFYSEANMSRLKTAISDAKEGLNMAKHELIEVDND
jgi:hypothetical protein